MELMITQCMDCLEVLSCRVYGSVIDIKTDCNDCDQYPGCKVKKNIDIFSISHGICERCLDKRLEEVNANEC